MVEVASRIVGDDLVVISAVMRQQKGDDEMYVVVVDYEPGHQAPSGRGACVPARLLPDLAKALMGLYRKSIVKPKPTPEPAKEQGVLFESGH